MIEKIRFENFKALKDATLDLGPLNVLVGPNGSGKSSVLQALEAIRLKGGLNVDGFRTVGTSNRVLISLAWTKENEAIEAGVKSDGKPTPFFVARNGANLPTTSPLYKDAEQVIGGIRVYTFEPAHMGEVVGLEPNGQMSKTGAGLVAGLDRLRDMDEAAYEQLRSELQLWLPEFLTIVFETPSPGKRGFKLKQRGTGELIKSRDLSEGTLVALALLLISHDSSPRSLVCLEEPDRGLHPRLLRDMRDALFRLCFPQEFGLKRQPVQVIVTTHSPIFLNLLSDHPEVIVVADKHNDGTASFHRVETDPHYRDIIGDGQLGEIWFTGVLGGVPAVK